MTRDEFWFWFGVWTSILALVIAGTVTFTGLIPGEWEPKVVKVCANLFAINNVILTAAKMRGYLNAKAAADAAKTVASVLLVAFLLSTFLAIPSAQAQGLKRPADPFVQKLRDDFQANTGIKPTGDLANDLLKALDAKLLPDLQYALLLAKATGSNVTAPCWQAWIDMINTQQTAVKNADGTETPAPDPHLVTSFERMVELRNALQPDSKFMTACSPVANLVKQDVIKFMGIVISGGTGLATMIPGL